MIALLAKFIDWSVLQIAYGVVGLNHAPRPRWKLEEAVEFLNGPDFIPAASEPARVEFDGQWRFRFLTPRPGKVDENNIVHGRLYRCSERWRERPVIIISDGYPAIGEYTAFPFVARRFNRAGINVATLAAPYNRQRRSRQAIEWDCLESARTMAQNVSELRAFTGWLLGEGCPSVGLLGISFGGWAVGLTACSDARIGSVVMAMPAVAWRMWRSPPPVVWPRVRREFRELGPAHEALDATRLNLILSTPVIPKEKILLIRGLHDCVFADSAPVEDLWQKWGRPDIWRLPHGHISVLFMPGLLGRVLNWQLQKLNTAPKIGPGSSL